MKMTDAISSLYVGANAVLEMAKVSGFQMYFFSELMLTLAGAIQA